MWWLELGCVQVEGCRPTIAAADADIAARCIGFPSCVVLDKASPEDDLV
jgi:hypothetical protein